jgi:hypothetical protein
MYVYVRGGPLHCDLHDLLCSPFSFIPLNEVQGFAYGGAMLLTWFHKIMAQVSCSLAVADDMCAWFFLCKSDYWLIPIWEGVVLWVGLPPTVAGFCLILTAPLFFWYEREHLPVWGLLRNLNVPVVSVCLVPHCFLGNSHWDVARWLRS